MQWTITVPPSAYPVTYSQVSDHLRLDQTDDQTYVTELIADAFDDLQSELEASLMPQTIVATYYEQPITHRLHLPRGPVKSVTSVVANGVTAAASAYSLKRSGNTDFLYIAGTLTAPIVITYQAGYSNIAADISAGYPTLPNDLRRALYLTLANYYENREAQAAKALFEDAAFCRIITRNKRTKMVG